MQQSPVVTAKSCSRLMSHNKNIKKVDNIVQNAVDEDKNYLSSWWRCLMHVCHILGYCMAVVLALTIYTCIFSNNIEFSKLDEKGVPRLIYRHVIFGTIGGLTVFDSFSSASNVANISTSKSAGPKNALHYTLPLAIPYAIVNILCGELLIQTINIAQNIME